MLAVTVAFILTSALVVGCSSQGSVPRTRGPTPATPTLRFDVVTKTRQKLDSIVWTGRQFLYVQNTREHGLGRARRQDTRCTVPRRCQSWWRRPAAFSPRLAGVPTGGILYRNSPDDKISVGTSPNAASVTGTPTLPTPYPPASDGALRRSTVGGFGYRLVSGNRALRQP